MSDPVHFELSAGERATPLWVRLRAHLIDKLNTARARNDGMLSEQETAALRGQIRTLKSLISLGDDRPIIDD